MSGDPDAFEWRYILVGHEAAPEPDLLKWAKWFDTADRCVADTRRDDVRVSTVFLGLDHGFGHGPPLLFETMVFVNGSSEGMARYATWDEAVEGHQRMVMQVFKPTPILKLPMKA